VPNSFTPNGDGLNDRLLLFGYGVRDMRMMIFNQWGEKIFETGNQNTGWDGTYNGKPQPSGVYMYVCTVTLTDGTQQTMKGSINLIR
jgi:gliding motility-associated-like protein